MTRARTSFIKACTLLALSLSLYSCPNPIDTALARKVEDTTPPAITIVTPDPAATYFYGATLDIAGFITDSADTAGRVQGAVQSLVYEEMYDKRIQGEVALASDGSFAISIDAYSPIILHGNLYILLKAVDWNGNSSERVVPAYDRTTGPVVVVRDHGPADFNGYTSSLAAAVTLTIQGVVELPTFYLKFDVDPQAGSDILDRDIPFDPVTGEFSFDFTPSVEGVSGELKFILRAEDSEEESTTIFYLQDDPVAPQLTSGTVAAENTSIHLTFSEGIYHAGGTAPLPADFSGVYARNGGTALDAVLTGLVGTPSGGDTALELGLFVLTLLPPNGAETITVTGANLTDRVGNPLAAAFDSVTLHLRDKTAPAVAQVGSAEPVGSAYKAGEVVPLTVSFSEPVTVTPPLTLALNAGTAAAYASGSGTSTLTLNYTVQDGQNVDPLNYTSTAALAGTVTDLEGNPAVLMLPDPAAAALVGRSLRIDTIAPAVPTVQIGTDELILKEENLAGVPFTVTGEDGAGYDLTLTNGTLLAGTDPGVLPAAGFALRGSGTGTFTVTVAVTTTDRAGNSSSGADSCQVNLTAPNPPLVTGASPTGDTTPSWSWSSGGGGSGTYRCRLDDGELSGATPTTATAYTSPTVLGEGGHTLYVQERNAVGNWSDSGSRTIQVDLTAPDPPSVTGSSPTSDPTPTWSWTPGGGGNGTYRCRLDSSPQAETTSLSYTPSMDLGEGDHTLYVQERDDAGNWSAEDSLTITIDLTPPDPPSVWTAGDNPTTDTTPTWQWTPGGGGNGTYRRRLDGGSLTTTTSTSYTPTAMGIGEHTLEVQERDGAGNWSGFGSLMIEVIE